MRVIADITDADIIQKILGHIEAQLLPIKLAPAIQSYNIPRINKPASTRPASKAPK